jgi:hypothetical protein
MLDNSIKAALKDYFLQIQSRNFMEEGYMFKILRFITFFFYKYLREHVRGFPLLVSIIPSPLQVHCYTILSKYLHITFKNTAL